MTRPASAPKSKTPKQPTTKQPNSPAPIEPVVTLQPRRGLFYALLVIFAIWIGFLVTLYFTTVFEKTDVHLEHNLTPTTR